MRVPDTHAHLDADQFDGDRDEVMERAKRAGLVRILAVGSDLRTSKQAVAFAHLYPLVFAAVGLHPHEASHLRDEADELKALLDDDKVVAVGEVGLDFYHEWVPRATQLTAFRAQIEWAVERGLPLSVHSRGAETEVLKIIGEMQPVAILHCFGGDHDIGMHAVELGCYLSFAGNVTYRNAAGLREAARAIPVERLLVETDAPVLAPQSHRGKRNEPAFVIDTLACLAREHDLPVEQLGETICATAANVLGWDAE